MVTSAQGCLAGREGQRGRRAPPDPQPCIIKSEIPLRPTASRTPPPPPPNTGNKPSTVTQPGPELPVCLGPRGGAWGGYPKPTLVQGFNGLFPSSGSKTSCVTPWGVEGVPAILLLFSHLQSGGCNVICDWDQSSIQMEFTPYLVPGTLIFVRESSGKYAPSLALCTPPAQASRAGSLV